MLSRIQAVYRYIKAEKARSDALVEEGRQVLGWRSSNNLGRASQAISKASTRPAKIKWLQFT
jgi:hypothetical protein